MKLEFWGVVVERDSNFTDLGRPPRGPMIFEGYADSSLELARQRAADLRGRYGWAYVAKVTVDTEAPENKA